MKPRDPALVLAAALAATPLLAPPASAATSPAPERLAWYSAASGGGLALPQPVTAEEDLKVARDVQTQAVSTLLFKATGVRASLEVTLRPSGAGTPDIVACPTKTTDWKARGNQPIDAAPEIDCARSTGLGVLSEDGLTLSFALDGEFQVGAGVWSIALVPAPGDIIPGPPPVVPLPFSVDIAPPEAGAFVAEEEFVLSEQRTDLPDDFGTTPGGSTGTETGGGTGSQTDLAGSFHAGNTSGAAPLEEAVAPALAPDAEVGGDAPAPAIAGGPADSSFTARPVSAVGDGGALRRLLALLVLAGGCIGIGFAAGQQRPALRLLGGRAKHGTAAVAAESLEVPDERPRGIGRFARVRDAAPRRLS